MALTLAAPAVALESDPSAAGAEEQSGVLAGPAELAAPAPEGGSGGEVAQAAADETVAVGGEQPAEAEEPAEEEATDPGGSPEAEAEAGAAEGSVEERPPADHITFDIPFPPERGGGSLQGSAGSIELLREDYLSVGDGAELRYRDLRVQAERMAVDLETKTLTAEGEVILDQGPRRITGSTMTFDLEAETGELSDARAYVDPDFYFTGERIAKVGEDTYTVHSGTITSCTDKVPDWSFRISKARVRVEGYARVHNARFRIKKLPLLYSPYVLWPAKTKRTSGLLVPNFGYTNLRGEYLGLAYFQTLGRSYDTTFFVDLFSEEFYGFGNELRYRPSLFTEGIFQGYAIEDPIEDEVRWKLSWNHTTSSLPWGMRGVVSYRDFSDFEFFRDFERDFNDINLRFIYSSAYATGNWGPHSFNLLLDDRETFIRGDTTVVQRQLPEVEYRLRATQLFGLPLYLEMVSGLHYFTVQRTEVLDAKYERAFLIPSLTVPLRSWPWLSISVSGGGSATWYGDSLDETGGEFVGESLTRFFPTAGAEIVGPSFSRIFEGEVGSFGKFKHIIEPRWDYIFVDEFEEQSQVPVFDEVDRLQARNLGIFTLANRLLAKPKDETLGDTREILLFEVGQGYSFDEEQPLQVSRDGTLTSRRGPLVSRLRFNPTATVSVESRVNYNTLFNHLTSTSLSGSYGSRAGNNVSLSWFTILDPEASTTRSNQLRAATGVDLWPQRLRLEAGWSYDIQRQLLQQQRYILQYNSNCFNLRLEAWELDVTNRRDREFRFAFSLKNVGTFLDLTGGQRTVKR